MLDIPVIDQLDLISTLNYFWKSCVAKMIGRFGCFNCRFTCFRDDTGSEVVSTFSGVVMGIKDPSTLLLLSV